jgi:hypothetical protein
VSADLFLVFGCEIHESVGVIESELAFALLSSFPLHRPLGCDLAKVALNDGSILAFNKLVLLSNRPKVGFAGAAVEVVDAVGCLALNHDGG